MKIDGGAIIWARQTIDSEIFYNKPDKWFKIWFYLVAKANHTDNKRFKEGSCFLKYDWIMNATGANKNEVDHCIRWLKSATMIATQKATRGFIVNVLNYPDFQNLQNYKSDTKSDAIGEVKAKQKRNKSDTINKNVKNDKNVKNTIADLKKSSAGDTDIQKIVNYFFKLKGWDDKSKEFYKKSKIVYSRYVRPAKELLYLCDSDLKEAGDCLRKVAVWAKTRQLDWSIETVFKKWYELDELRPADKKAYIGHDRAFMMGDKWYILKPNGEKFTYTGDKNNIIYK